MSSLFGQLKWHALKRSDSQNETAGKLSLPAGRECEELELVAQTKLHYTRIRQQSGVISEIAAVGE
jgi:hypothetical protein